MKLFFFDSTKMKDTNTVIDIEKIATRAAFKISNESNENAIRLTNTLMAANTILAAIMCAGFVRFRNDNKVIEVLKELNECNLRLQWWKIKYYQFRT